MGGTMLRMAEHRHEVHVAYQVSGSDNVQDDVLQRYLDFGRALGGSFSENPDSTEWRTMKAAVRQAEARAAARVCQVDPQRLHFLDLPFYRRAPEGHRSVGAEDIELTLQLLREVKPHQIYAAGDLADPHGTHRICLEILQLALKQLSREQWLGECEAWLYRGTWAEWPIHEVDMAVPLSPAEVACKLRAIFQHESQKNLAALPEADRRAFGEKSDEFARGTSRLFDALGLSDYEAMETFRRWEIKTPSS